MRSRRACWAKSHAIRYAASIRSRSAVLEFEGGTSTFTCGTQLAPYQRVNIFGTTGRIEIEIPFNAPPDRPCRMWLQTGGQSEHEDRRDSVRRVRSVHAASRCVRPSDFGRSRRCRRHWPMRSPICGLLSGFSRVLRRVRGTRVVAEFARIQFYTRHLNLANSATNKAADLDPFPAPAGTILAHFQGRLYEQQRTEHEHPNRTIGRRGES